MGSQVKVWCEWAISLQLWSYLPLWSSYASLAKPSTTSSRVFDFVLYRATLPFSTAQRSFAILDLSIRLDWSLYTSVCMFTECPMWSANMAISVLSIPTTWVMRCRSDIIKNYYDYIQLMISSRQTLGPMPDRQILKEMWSLDTRKQRVSPYRQSKKHSTIII